MVDGKLLAFFCLLIIKCIYICLYIKKMPQVVASINREVNQTVEHIVLKTRMTHSLYEAKTIVSFWQK